MKQFCISIATVLALGIILGGGHGLDACEIQLRSSVVVRGAVIRLSDIATVVGLDAADRAALEQMIIAPAPTPSGSRTISAAQLRYWLKQHGVETEKCQMSGAAHVTILGRRGKQLVSDVDSTVAKATSLPAKAGGMSHNLTAVKQQLVQAVRTQLGSGGVRTADWSVAVDLPRRALWSLPSVWTGIQVEGLRPDLLGKQVVTARFESPAGTARIPVTVQLRRSERIVFALHELARGDVIGPNDVELRPVDNGRVPSRAARTLAEVVGHEARRSIGAGHSIDTNAIRLPVVVRRRDVVDVASQTEGVVVRRHAIATQDGSVGDVIVLEAIDNRRERFSAQVTGHRTATVFVSAPTVLPRKVSRN